MLAMALDCTLTRNVDDNPVMGGTVHRKHVSLYHVVAAHDVGLSLAVIEGLAFENARPYRMMPAFPVDIDPAAADTVETTGSG